MDRYASRLAHYMSHGVEGLDVAVAGPIGSLTAEHGGTSAIAAGSGTHRLEPVPNASEFKRYLSRYWLYPRRVRRTPADLVHILDHSYAHVLLVDRRPSVVTVHDLFPVITLSRAPSGLRERIRNRFLRRVLAGLHRADAWVVATEWLRVQLSEYLDREDPIRVVPYGIDPEFFDEPAETKAEIRNRWGIADQAFVILHVGSVDRRKNVPTVIAALDQLRSDGVDAWFLQVGGSLDQRHRQDIADRGLDRFVTQLGPVLEPDLRAAYHAADVLLFPSLYEGFGLPVLEAMASGLPVITSGAGGLAEVSGDAALIVGGREAKPYTDALRRIADDSEYRLGLVEKGRSRAANFTWAETARRTAQVYRELF